MTGSHLLFYAFLIAGIFLVCVEMFVPGAVLGVLGTICLAGSIVMAFAIFPGQIAVLVTMGILILLGASVIAWAKLFPKSGIGRAMTLSKNQKGYKASGDAHELIGKEGEALSDLRPSGFAMIDGHRTDVITDGEMIARGMRVRVVAVEGNRTIVAGA